MTVGVTRSVTEAVMEGRGMEVIKLGVSRDLGDVTWTTPRQAAGICRAKSETVS